MKKNLLILLFLVILAIGAGLFLLTRGASRSMEQICPPGALMYIRLNNLSKDLDQYIQSGFWKNISSIDLPKVLEHNNVSQEDAKNLQKTQKEVEAFMMNPLTRKFLGNEVSFAFYDKNESSKDHPYDVLFASRLGFSLQMAELFVSMAHQWGDEMTTRNERYGGFNIVHVHFSKRNLDVQYIRLHDILVASFSPSNILHEVVDIYQKQKFSLASDPDFSKALSRVYPKSHGIFYVNIQRLMGIVDQHIPSAQKKNYQQISHVSEGFKSYTISFLPGEVLKLRMVMQFYPDKLSDHWKALLSCNSVDNSSLKFVPHDVVAYHWGQCYDFKEMLKDMGGTQNPPVPKAGIEKLEHRFEKRFKFNVENDILPVVGSQAGWYLNDVDTQGLFPYPRGAAFIKIQDRLAAENIMQKVTKNSLSLLKDEDYQQTSIHYMTLPLGVNMDPGYTFIGDYLLIGSSKETLKASIDAFYNSNHSLLSTNEFKQFNITPAEKDQGVAFIKIDDVSSRLQQLLDWYNKAISSQITGALAYQQEIQDKKKELDESFEAKNEELKLAQRKYKDVLSKSAQTASLTDEEKINQQANIDHLTSDISILQEDVHSLNQQKQELRNALVTYKEQVESAKLWLFNSDEVLKPVLKAFQNLHSLGMRWHLSGQMSEMEILIK